MNFSRFIQEVDLIDYFKYFKKWIAFNYKFYPPCPTGYEIVTKDNYLIKNADLFYLTNWFLNGNFSLESVTKFTYRFAKSKTIIETIDYFDLARNEIIIYSKKPRFTTDKKFPFGY